MLIIILGYQQTLYYVYILKQNESFDFCFRKTLKYSNQIYFRIKRPELPGLFLFLNFLEYFLPDSNVVLMFSPVLSFEQMLLPLTDA